MFEWFHNNPVFRDYLSPALDILILAFLFYQMYKLFIQTRAIQMVRWAILVLGLYGIALALNLATLLWLLRSLTTILLIIFAVVFQPELRNIFARIGRRGLFTLTTATRDIDIDTILNAVDVLSSRKRGALIVFTRQMGLRHITDTGTRVNADLSSSLVLTVFGFDTPMHDGAMVISNDRILATGCFLPLSEQVDIKRSFGTRHRAALGLAEESDAVILLVSEETGAVSLAYDSNLHYDLSTNEIKKALKELLSTKADSPDSASQEDI